MKSLISLKVLLQSKSVTKNATESFLKILKINLCSAKTEMQSGFAATVVM